MKRFFTLFLLLISYYTGFSQSYAFRVDTPVEQAGLYSSRVGGFGPGVVYDLAGEVVVATPNDACSAITNDLTGKIALIDRGTCQFGSKSLRAQDAGAIAVIICNNVDGGGAMGMAGGDDGDDVTIPVVSLSKEDCATLRIQIPNLTITLLSQYDENEVAIWGNDPSEGQFTGGLNGWTTQGISGTMAATALWDWDANGSASKGGFADADDAIISATALDGAAVFNSDFLDNGGDSLATNMGTSPAPHSGELISPILDLSNASEVSLRFNQYYKNRNSATSVAFSTDGGTTWSDPIRVNEDVGSEDATNRRSIQTIYLPGLGGSDMARVKFIFDGSLHFWIVDDVKIIEAELYSSRLTAILFPPSNYGTPASMIAGDSMFFSTLVTNDGLKDLTDVTIKGSIIGGESILYEDSAKLATVEVGIQDTSLFIDGGYEPPALDVGSYIARYNLTQANPDYSPSNNVVNLPFEITENTFQKDNGILISGTRPTANTAYEYGNLYYVSTGGYKATQATFSVAINAGTNLAGQNYLIKLYKVDEDDNTEAFTDDDVELVGIANEVFPDDFESFDFLTVDMLDFNSLEPGVVLEEDTEYILMFSYAGTDNVFTTYTDVPYGNRVTDILRVEGSTNGAGPWFTGGFTGQTTPVVRMHIDQVSSAKEPELAENKLQLFPNPTVDEINVSLLLDRLSPNVEILIRDLSGKTLQQYTYKNVKENQFTLDTRPLEGMYIMTIRTNEGVKSKKFMVIKTR